jgi:hypothetical protein
MKVRRPRGKTVPAHTLEITVRVPEWVPTHAERTESEEFAKNRQRLIDDGFGYCFGCKLAGKHVTENLQCHHLSEWAEWDDADPEKVLALARWIDPYGYAAKDPDTPISSPDDIRLLVMLCQPCHTGAPRQPDDPAADPTGYESGGIHYAPFPVWLAERVKKSGGTA